MEAQSLLGINDLKAMADLLAPKDNDGYDSDDYDYNGAVTQNRTHKMTPMTAGMGEVQDDEVERSSSAIARDPTDANFKMVIKPGKRLPKDAKPTVGLCHTDATKKEDNAQEQQSKANSGDIWTEQDLIASEVEEFELRDGRTAPDYEILYKQALSAEDTYMNFGFKDSSSSCCEAIVIKIPLPLTTTFADVQLDVTSSKILLRSQHYKLMLHLPHVTEDDKGKAVWDSSTRILKITLPIVKDRTI